ncbi:leucine-rich repeat protein kinase family protein [Actinidia rufa]|uniref:non-specific serine/threonine protein kinase n=1 Tax=Actinidia rufa TaxID=165716 RepID=A0A7J0E5B4_9ERIC|nr:leucine-rich repeat protein kinase family protein [Actinidia rufa]
MATVTAILCLLCFLAFGTEIQLIASVTDPGDDLDKLTQIGGGAVVALRSLKAQWQNTPPSWDKSSDPCGAPWEGVTCNNSRVTALGLSTMGLIGKLNGDIGGLTELRSLDLSFNRGLTGSLSSRIGDLQKLNILHFNKNQLSGTIPAKLFSSDMVLLHVLFDGNQIRGEIPDTLGLVQTLEVLRLDRNALIGDVPSNLNNLTNIVELNLAHNNLFGPLPNLTGMNSLSYVDLSNNSFQSSEAPTWFSSLQSLTTLVMEFGSLQGALPEKLFSLPQIQQVKLRSNEFNDTLNMGNSISQELQLVDLQNNRISTVTLVLVHVRLIGNPVCTSALANTEYCQLQQQQSKVYSTSLANCGSNTCSPDQNLNPQSCDCAYPYEGTLYFRGPSFRELSNANMFHSLEMSLWMKLGLTPGSVSLQNPFFNIDDYLQVQLELFPSTGKYFNRTEIVRLGFALSNQTYKPPQQFGPYYFIASPYLFPEDEHGRTSISTIAMIGIVSGCGILVLVLLGLGVYAFRQKKRAEKAIGLSKPFASWVPSGKDSGGAPQLKGARWFSYVELKKCTSHFSESNEIGSGGYGKVYRGLLPGGQLVAIKRAQQGSMQGGLEFKTEIELLSRVHHKNLVGLVGFCFEQGEQMLVYEFMPNGTLRESLSGWCKKPSILSKPTLVNWPTQGYVQGYLDPEYYMTQQLTEKSDVYSFGVVMLELVTAKQPIEKGKYIVREVRTVMDENDQEHYGMRELIDPTIKNMANLTGFGRFLELAMQCLEESAADRPTMSEVVKALETILQNDGLNTNSTSASSSANEFGSTKVAPPQHPYDDVLPKKDVNETTDAFDYSGGYTLPAKVEPK